MTELKNNSFTKDQKKFKRTSLDIEGSKLSLKIDYGGLGYFYFDKLASELDKFLQVDTVTGLSETKGSVRSRSIQLAIEMRARGIVPNDIIVIISRNCAEQTLVVLATLFLGAIVAPLDPDFSYKECLELVTKLKPKLYFCDVRALSILQRIFIAMNSKLAVVIVFGEVCAETVQFSKLFNKKFDDNFRPYYIENPRETVAFILPTQGTADEPKLICLSHQNIMVQTKIFVDLFNHPEKVISFFPLSWILQTVLMCVTFETTTIRILPGVFKERTACKIIHDFGIGHAIFGTDYAMRLIENSALKDYNLHCLKVILIGTLNSTRDDIRQLKLLMPHVKFLQCYCPTETGCIATVTVANYETSLSKIGTVGRICPNCKIRIVDVETKESCKAGQRGECYFHGDGMMLGYFKQSEKTHASIDKGYFKTGDMAEYDEDGWLYLKGRIADLIVRVGNFIIFPYEIEEAILAHPLVKDVAVVGNEKEVIACVIRRPDKRLTMERLLKFIYERIPEKHRPTRVLLMDNFPRTSIGNVKKRILKDDLLSVKIAHTRSLASIAIA